MSKADRKEPGLIKAIVTKLIWMLVSKKFIAFAVATVLLVHDHISDNVWEIIALGFIGAVVIEKAVQRKYPDRP
jgi:hypothetical protein